MNLFTKPLDTLTAEDITELVNTHHKESIDLEFKESAISTEKMMKEVCAFANTHGGVIIVGVRESEDSRGVASSLVPIPKEKLENFITSIQDATVSLLSPPVFFESGLVPIPSDEGCVAVIRVPLSLEAPHSIKKTGAAYLRVADKSHPVELRMARSEEVVFLSQRKQAPYEAAQSIRRKAHERFDQWTKIHIRDAAQVPLYKVFIGPVVLDPKLKLDRSLLRQKMDQILYTNDDCSYQTVTDGAILTYFDSQRLRLKYFELNSYGYMLRAEDIANHPEDLTQTKNQVLDSHKVIQITLATIRAYRKSMLSNAYLAPIELRVELDQTLGRKTLVKDWRELPTHVTLYDESVVVKANFFFAELSSLVSAIEPLTSFFSEIYWALGNEKDANNLASIREYIRKNF